MSEEPPQPDLTVPAGSAAPSPDAKPASSGFRNSFVFALGMVAPPTSLVICFGFIMRAHRMHTSEFVLSTIFLVVGEFFFVLSALLPFLFASLLLRKRAAITGSRLFWGGCGAGCTSLAALVLIGDGPNVIVPIVWLLIAFFAALFMLLAWGGDLRARRRREAAESAPSAE